ncbi:hypothetical protein F6B84_15260 [Vibrio cholerae]|nr:hypothetical protein [Vibrio cholerae]
MSYCPASTAGLFIAFFLNHAVMIVCISPSYLKLQRCWLRSFTPITSCVYAHEDELTCCLPATPSSLGITGLNARIISRTDYGLKIFHILMMRAFLSCLPSKRPRE